MKIHEYVGKELLGQYGIPVPQSLLFTEKAAAAGDVMLPCVLKSQVLVGGRMKAGGVLFAESRDEFTEKLAVLLKRTIKGAEPVGVLCEEKLEIVQEYYLSLMIDRGERDLILVFSEQGGINIEENTGTVLKGPFAKMAAQLPEDLAEIALNLHRLLCDKDLTLIEVNPIGRLSDGRLMALDAVLDVDDNALWRQQWAQPFVPDEGYPFHFVKLDGEIGIIGCGAGIVMGTMDAVTDAGGKPADFLDLGGGAQKEVTLEALQLLTSFGIKRIILNIFGGITKCNEIAEGLAQFKSTHADIELFIKLKGTNDREGKRILHENQIAVYDDLYHMVEEAVRGIKSC